MSRRGFALLLFCVLILGVLAGAIGPRLGISPRAGTLVAAAAAAGIYLYLDRRAGRARVPRASEPRAGEPYVSPYEVRFDEAAVVVTHHGAPFGRVAWVDLLTVGIRIEDDSFLPEPWWLLFDRGTGASYPSSARGGREMLAELQRRLPGFDNTGVVQAMGLTSGGVVVWERASAGKTTR